MGLEVHTQLRRFHASSTPTTTLCISLSLATLLALSPGQLWKCRKRLRFQVLGMTQKWPCTLTRPLALCAECHGNSPTASSSRAFHVVGLPPRDGVLPCKAGLPNENEERIRRQPRTLMHHGIWWRCQTVMLANNLT